MVTRTIQGITPYIEALYGRQKALAIARRYRKLRKELGKDVCAVLDTLEMLEDHHDAVTIEDHNRTRPMEETIYAS